MDIAGWALPGGIVKHNAVQETGLKESPEKFFLLLFAPLGCLFFQGHAGLSNGERDKRTQTLVAVPRPRQLRSFVDLLLRFYERTGSERASGKVPLIRVQGVKEAALQAAMLLHLQNTPKLRRLSCDFTVVRFGTVSWSAQQKHGQHCFPAHACLRKPYKNIKLPMTSCIERERAHISSTARFWAKSPTIWCLETMNGTGEFLRI